MRVGQHLIDVVPPLDFHIASMTPETILAKAASVRLAI
jgi:hypothetical protein